MASFSITPGMVYAVGMSRSNHHGKGYRHVEKKPSFKGERDTIHKSNTWGSTHRILQRGKKIWSRLLGKRRRSADKDAIRASED